MNGHDEILDFVRGVLSSFLDVDSGSITGETRIRDLKMESLDFIDLQLEIEKAYGVHVQPAVLAQGQVLTMHDFVSYIQRLHETGARAERR